MYVDLSWDGTQSWIVKVYDEMETLDVLGKTNKQQMDRQKQGQMKICISI